MGRRGLGLAALCVVMATGLAACGAARPDIVTATPDRISYSWDTEASTLGEVTDLAEAHCRQFGKNASLANNTAASQSGTFFTTIYDCVLP